eukprot:7384524-Prymnesium_polylepis.1
MQPTATRTNRHQLAPCFRHVDTATYSVSDKGTIPSSLRTVRSVPGGCSASCRHLDQHVYAGIRMNGMNGVMNFMYAGGSWCGHVAEAQMVKIKRPDNKNSSWNIDIDSLPSAKDQ